MYHPTDSWKTGNGQPLQARDGSESLGDKGRRLLEFGFVSEEGDKSMDMMPGDGSPLILPEE